MVASRGPISENGEVSGLAADILWVGDSGELVLYSSGAAVATFIRVGKSLTVRVAGLEQETEISVSGPVRVLVDGPILEVSSNGTIFGAAINPTGKTLTAQASHGTLEVFPLG